MASDTLRQLYNLYAPAIAFVSVINKNGEESIGTAFHIGDGIFVTVRHVLEDHKIVKIAITEYGRRYLDEQCESGYENLCRHRLVARGLLVRRQLDNTKPSNNKTKE